MTPPREGSIFSSQARKRLGEIGKVLLVGSGKGGVGKSLVACGLGVSLSQGGSRAGLLDLDLHGSSVPAYLGLEPPMRSSDEGLEPKLAGNLKVMSPSLFTGSNPLPIRGKEKPQLIEQLFAQTNWGGLDYLLVDLPPGTGDEVLSAFRLFAQASLILVTTPSKIALKVVSLLKALADTEKVPVEGVVLNMAYESSDGTKSFPLGRLEGPEIGRALGAELLAEIPLDPIVNSRSLTEILGTRNDVSTAISNLSRRIAALRQG